MSKPRLKVAAVVLLRFFESPAAKEPTLAAKFGDIMKSFLIFCAVLVAFTTNATAMDALPYQENNEIFSVQFPSKPEVANVSNESLTGTNYMSASESGSYIITYIRSEKTILDTDKKPYLEASTKSRLQNYPGAKIINYQINETPDYRLSLKFSHIQEGIPIYSISEKFFISDTETIIISLATLDLNHELTESSFQQFKKSFKLHTTYKPSSPKEITASNQVSPSEASQYATLSVFKMFFLALLFSLPSIFIRGIKKAPFSKGVAICIAALSAIIIFLITTTFDMGINLNNSIGLSAAFSYFILQYKAINISK